MRDLFGYQGKRVVITGAASGMAQAAARLLVELGAEVYALDRNEVTVPVRQYIKVDLLHKDSIDAAVKQIPDNLYALFNCAGTGNPPLSALDVTLINFVGHRHLTESLLPKINDGGAIAFISSQGGIAWRSNFDTINKLLAATSYEEARAWLEANEEVNSGYIFSKQCICAYAKTRAEELAKRNIRINCILPGNTETGLTPQFLEDGTVVSQGAVVPQLSGEAGKAVADAIRGFLDMSKGLTGRAATAEEQAEPLVFLNSNMARFISGENLVVDFGCIANIEVGRSPDLFGL